MAKLGKGEVKNGHYVTVEKYYEFDGIGVFITLKKKRWWWVDKSIEIRYVTLADKSLIRQPTWLARYAAGQDVDDVVAELQAKIPE